LGSELDELVPRDGTRAVFPHGEGLSGEQEFGGKGVDYRLPLSSRCVNSEVAGVLVTDDQMAKLVGSGCAPTPWIASETDDRDRNIAVQDRCSIARDLCHEYELTGLLAQFDQ
jgi:hypothetical protein